MKSTPATARKLFITWSPVYPEMAELVVVEERPKAWKARNTDNGVEVWIPKSGVKPRRPGANGETFAPTYEDEYVLRDWFRAKCSHRQMMAVGAAE